MKTIRVSYQPAGLKWAALGGMAAALFIGVLAGTRADESTRGMGALVGSMVFLCYIVLLVGFSMLLSSRKTVVEYDSETVHWVWLWKEQKVCMDDVKEFYYTIREHRGGYGSVSRTLEVRFIMKNDDMNEPVINDSIGTEMIAAGMSGDTENIPLMRLYNDLAEAWKDKAAGYRRSGNIWE